MSIAFVSCRSWNGAPPTFGVASTMPPARSVKTRELPTTIAVPPTCVNCCPDAMPIVRAIDPIGASLMPGSKPFASLSRNTWLALAGSTDSAFVSANSSGLVCSGNTVAPPPAGSAIT